MERPESLDALIQQTLSQAQGIRLLGVGKAW